MDYKKKYEEVLEKAKQWHKDGYGHGCQEVMEDLFPELKESKGEKIRKHLIGVVELYYGKTDEQEKKDCLAWLEKQGEQKPAWSEEDERLRTSCIKHIEEELERIRNDKYGHSEIISDLKESCRERINWLESLRPQSHWRPSEEQIEALESATENCAYSEYQDCLRELIGQLNKL